MGNVRFKGNITLIGKNIVRKFFLLWGQASNFWNNEQTKWDG